MTAPEQHVLPHADRAAGPIEKAEDWLVAECRRLLDPPFKSIESGPGDWNEEYLTRLIKQVPAIRVVYLDSQSEETAALDMDSDWAIFIATGWSRGQREKDRRRGANGSYRAASLLAPWLHTCTIDGVGQVRVRAITNLWNGRLDKLGLSLVSVRLGVGLTFHAPVDVDEFADFVTAGVEWDIPEGGDADDPDATDTIQVRGS